MTWTPPPSFAMMEEEGKSSPSPLPSSTPMPSHGHHRHATEATATRADVKYQYRYSYPHNRSGSSPSPPPPPPPPAVVVGSSSSPSRTPRELSMSKLLSSSSSSSSSWKQSLFVVDTVPTSPSLSSSSPSLGPGQQKKEVLLPTTTQGKDEEVENGTEKQVSQTISSSFFGRSPSRQKQQQQQQRRHMSPLYESPSPVSSYSSSSSSQQSSKNTTMTTTTGSSSNGSSAISTTTTTTTTFASTTKSNSSSKSNQGGDGPDASAVSSASESSSSSSSSNGSGSGSSISTYSSYKTAVRDISLALAPYNAMLCKLDDELLLLPLQQYQGGGTGGTGGSCRVGVDNDDEDHDLALMLARSMSEDTPTSTDRYYLGGTDGKNGTKNTKANTDTSINGLPTGWRTVQRSMLEDVAASKDDGNGQNKQQNHHHPQHSHEQQHLPDKHEHEHEHENRLTNREVAAFWMGMRLMQSKVNSLSSQLESTKAMSRMTVQHVLLGGAGGSGGGGGAATATTNGLPVLRRTATITTPRTCERMTDSCNRHHGSTIGHLNTTTGRQNLPPMLRSRVASIAVVPSSSSSSSSSLSSSKSASSIVKDGLPFLPPLSPVPASPTKTPTTSTTKATTECNNRNSPTPLCPGVDDDFDDRHKPRLPFRPRGDGGNNSIKKQKGPSMSCTNNNDEQKPNKPKPFGGSKSLRTMSIVRIKKSVQALPDDDDLHPPTSSTTSGGKDCSNQTSNSSTSILSPPTSSASSGPEFGSESESTVNVTNKRDIQRLLNELEAAFAYQTKLEKQLAQAGVVIAEDIPYDVAKEQVTRIAARMIEIGSCDVHDPALQEEYFKLEQDMERYSQALQLTDEWAEEQEQLEREWESSVQQGCEVALSQVRRHMPVNVRNLSEAVLSTQPTPNGRILPKALAKKFKRTNVLQLLRIDPDDIAKLHPSMLENLRVTGLTLTERRALYLHLRDVGSRWKAQCLDKLTERKWAWWNMMKSNFKEAEEKYQRHIEQYCRDDQGQNCHDCKLIGKQCPVRADKVTDYAGDYGYPEGPEFFKSEIRKSDVDNIDKAKQDAAEALRCKKKCDRNDALKKHYKGNIFHVTSANGSCQAMDDTIDRMERLQEQWIRGRMDRSGGPSFVANPKKELAAFSDALNELKLAVFQFADRSGMQLKGKRDSNADGHDIRSMIELECCDNVVAVSKVFLTGIQERMDALPVKDGLIRSTLQQLRGLLQELHERNQQTIQGLLNAGETHRPESRKVRSLDEIQNDIQRELDSTLQHQKAKSTSHPPSDCHPATGQHGPPKDLLAALKNRNTALSGVPKRNVLMNAIKAQNTKKNQEEEGQRMVRSPVRPSSNNTSPLLAAIVARGKVN